ncbi:hypothetical protein ABVT39_011600 [Epinephelus coioides]
MTEPLRVNAHLHQLMLVSQTSRYSQFCVFGTCAGLSSSLSTDTMPESCNEEKKLLEEANKKIADLQEDIRRLSDELQKKESLLSSFMTRLPKLSSFFIEEQSKLSPPTTAPLTDTIVWDTAACPRPSCSTPKHGSSCVDVVLGNKIRVSSP